MRLRQRGRTGNLNPAPDWRLTPFRDAVAWRGDTGRGPLYPSHLSYPPALQTSSYHVTPPSRPAGIHGAGHPGWGGTPHAGVLEADADVFVAAPAIAQGAAASLAPRPYAGGLRYNALPIRTGDVAGGSR